MLLIVTGHRAPFCKISFVPVQLVQAISQQPNLLSFSAGLPQVYGIDFSSAMARFFSRCVAYRIFKFFGFVTCVSRHSAKLYTGVSRSAARHVCLVGVDSYHARGSFLYHGLRSGDTSRLVCRLGRLSWVTLGYLTSL